MPTPDIFSSLLLVTKSACYHIHDFCNGALEITRDQFSEAIEKSRRKNKQGKIKSQLRDIQSESAELDHGKSNIQDTLRIEEDEWETDDDDNDNEHSATLNVNK